MTVEVVKGCLLEAFDKGEVICIAQCVNTRGVMGAGLALQTKKKYPNVFNVYSKVCSQEKDRKLLLGEA